MFLMGDPIQRKAHETKDAGNGAVHVVNESVLAQHSVRGLVKADQRAVHEMADQQHERDRQPNLMGRHGKTQSHLRKDQSRADDREGGLTHPMRWWNILRVHEGGGNDWRSGMQLGGDGIHGGWQC